MHNALGQTQVELTAIDTAIAIGHHIQWAIQQED